MRQVFDHTTPDRFVAGTTGLPGARTFFLQARSGHRLTTVKLEKQQLAILAERVDELLDEVVRRSRGEAPVPAIAPVTAEDNSALDTPIEEEFAVGTMSLSWDLAAERVLIECFEATDTPQDDDSVELDDADADGGVLRVSLAGPAARAFVKRALAVVAAGRPPCPFCGEPLDPEGHICPRMNGYRR